VDKEHVECRDPGVRFQIRTLPTAAFAAGLGEVRGSFKGYGWGPEGYFKRVGASYADTADGNLWGNAIFPVIFHEDPRYFRKGTGTVTSRVLYSVSTIVRCKSDKVPGFRTTAM
jgi:hypothetical protein